MVRIRLKEILQERNMSQGKLSRLADVSPATITRIINDTSYSPTVEILARIAKALNIPIADLFEEIPD